MAKSDRYIQCMLTKENRSDVSWVPEKFAVEGKPIRVKPDGAADYEDGWTVAKVYSGSVMTEEAVKAARDAFRYHRDVTDI